MQIARPRSQFRRIRTSQRRSGFSLLEIMVVLAVFVVITALAVPMLRNTFAGQQLRSAADVVRAKFSQARVRAIESGDVYGFFYAPGSNQYFVAPTVIGFRTLASGQVMAIDERKLENEITFAAGETIQDARSMTELENSTFDPANMRPVLFYPDGTSQDATIILQNDKGLVIQIKLRGLTGVSKTTRVMSTEEVLR